MISFARARNGGQIDMRQEVEIAVEEMETDLWQIEAEVREAWRVTEGAEELQTARGEIDRQRGEGARTRCVMWPSSVAAEA